MSPDAPPQPPVERRTYDDALGRRIIELYVWAVQEGLRGAAADDLFDGFCQRLVAAGVKLWRGFVGTQTLHPQWRGISYLWRRDLNAIQPESFPRGGEAEPDWWLASPVRPLQARAVSVYRKYRLRPRLSSRPADRRLPRHTRVLDVSAT